MFSKVRKVQKLNIFRLSCFW